jgi:sensor histidine kinase YesM
LSIRIREDEDVLTFTIEDNGIGREAAQRLRMENLRTHNSMGINITEERLKLINLGQQAAFEVEDLKDENGPCGTRVKIMILLNAVK